MSMSSRAVILSTAAAVLTGFPTWASAQAAQDAPPSAAPANQPPQPPVSEDAGRASDAIMSDIIVTATKKTAGESLQKVPISAVALGSAQLQALQFRDLQSISFQSPNIQFDQSASQKGVANFSIRGISVNSSVPTVEPAVGTFVDGIYLGTNYGVNLDTFDVDSVEVLRGPQGVLFGRNVTGGAVSIRTRRPTGEFRVMGKASIDSGFRGTGSTVILAASVEDALVTDKLFGKLTGYYTHDGGYFKNTYLKKNDGKDDNFFIRPTFVFKPNDTLDLTLIAEHGVEDGDGPVSANPAGLAPNKHYDTNRNFQGYSHLRHDSVTFEANQEVGATGRITNIMGYREIAQRSAYDTDATYFDYYTLSYKTKQHQFSNELRYSDRLFDTTDITVGGIYFTQYIEQVTREELHNISPTTYRDYGGRQYQKSGGIFINTDTSITDRLKLGIGARYSIDHKRANVTRAVLTPAIQPCDFTAGVCTDFAFNDKKTFRSFTPRVALSYQATDNTQIYATYSKGYRSGGYSIRSTSNVLPGPFGDESADAYEIGLKTDLFDRRLRFNAAIFRTDVSDVQRQITTINGMGTVVVIGNAGDDRLQGFEADASLKVFDGFVLRGSVGYVDGKYTKVVFDLNGDRVVNAADLALKLPKLTPWTYGISAFYDTPIGDTGSLSLQASYNHRSGNFFNDANTLPLPAIDDVFASIAFQPKARPGTKISVYGRNLLDTYQVTTTGDLSSFPSKGFNEGPNKGRQIGLEVTFDL